MSDRRQGLTDAEFDALSRDRDEKLEQLIQAACAKWGWDRAKTHVHVGSGSTPSCYCACPDGPCQHDWTGPDEPILDYRDEPCGFERTCARCGIGAMSHDLRFMP